MTETASPSEPQTFQQSPPAEQHSITLHSPESSFPRSATFGAIEVHEDLKADLVAPTEKKLYSYGFAVLKTTVGAAENNIARMVLTTPDMVSGIVGLQPLVSMDTAEAGLLYQSFEHAGLDFHQDFSMLEFGKERNYVKILINDRATEQALRTYQQALGIALPERQLQKDEILTYTMRLLNSGDVRQANLAHGLLSGFPLADCQQWVNSAEATIHPIPLLKNIEDIDNRFGYQTRTGSDGRPITGRWNPIPNLNPENYSLQGSRNQFLPDTRPAIPGSAHAAMIEGFGLRWVTQLPPQGATIRHAQRLLQVDRELGLVEYANQQRSTFNVEDNTKAITIEKQLLTPTSPAPLAKVGGAAGLAFGILSLFSSVVEDATKEPKRS